MRVSTPTWDSRPAGSRDLVTPFPTLPTFRPEIGPHLQAPTLDLVLRAGKG